MSDAIKALDECEQQRGSEQHCVCGLVVVLVNGEMGGCEFAFEKAQD